MRGAEVSAQRAAFPGPSGTAPAAPPRPSRSPHLAPALDPPRPRIAPRRRALVRARVARDRRPGRLRVVDGAAVPDAPLPRAARLAGAGSREAPQLPRATRGDVPRRRQDVRDLDGALPGPVDAARAPGRRALRARALAELGVPVRHGAPRARPDARARGAHGARALPRQRPAPPGRAAPAADAAVPRGRRADVRERGDRAGDRAPAE